MTSENRPNPRFDEDLHFERGDRPPDYGYRTDGPVRHFAVADGTDTVLGYVWGNDEDDAAAWEPRSSAGPRAFNGGFLWEMKLREFKARGTAPTVTLAEMIMDSSDIESSHVVAGSQAEAPTLAALKELAREPDTA
ncbi:hypothetical protein [Streptomyces sp. NRRL S-1824]|uniref:hypothetical protein n=1 Tax=Streptomyces sp. NRRL S-1824 TaxID=1463889 RepID=UPI0004C98F39|nr:hypothetical protein [Streptomyces sp. NRRL S-1824]